MPTRISTRINGPNAGWSETLYHSQGLDEHTTTFWQSLCDDLIAARRPLMHSACYVFDMRLSDVLNARKTLVFPQQNKVGTWLAIDPTDTLVDQLWTRCLIRYNLANGGIMRNFLGGIPDEASKTSSQQITQGTWLTRFSAWRSWVLSRALVGWGINPATQVKQDITAWDIVDNLVRVQVVDNSGFSTNSKVRVSRSIMEPDLNGTWKVENISNNFLVLKGSTTTLPAVSWQPNTGVVLSQAKSASAIGGVEQIRLTKHNPGRPFGIARGRSRRKRRQVPLIPQAV